MIELIQTKKKVGVIETGIYKLNQTLSHHQTKHAVNFVKGLIYDAKTSILRISKLFGEKNHSNMNDFFTEDYWDEERVNEKRIIEFINEGGIFVLVSDDTNNLKRGKKIKGSGTFKSKTSNGFEHAHNKVFTGLVNYKGEFFPLFSDIYIKEEDAKDLDITFKTKHEIVREHYKKAVSLGINFYVHIYDSAYLNHGMIEFIGNDKHIVSILSSNYVITVENTRQKAGDFKQNIDKRKMKVIQTKNKKIRYLDYVAELTTGKQVKLVFFIDEEGKDIKILFSTNLNWSAKRIVQEYAKRQAIEVFFKDCKQELNFGKSRFKELKPHAKWDTLVMLAYNIVRNFIKTKDAIKLRIKTVGQAVDYLKEQIQVRSLFINP